MDNLVKKLIKGQQKIPDFYTGVYMNEFSAYGILCWALIFYCHFINKITCFFNTDQNQVLISSIKWSSIVK